MMRPTEGIEIYRHAEDLLGRIADYTIGAQEVSTLNISPAPTNFTPLVSYFDRVNRYLARGGRARIRTFRSIASLQDAAKVKAIVLRAEMLEGCGAVSLGVIDPELSSKDFFLLGLHMVRRDEGYACFIFPRVQLSGSMQGVLIHGKESYDALMGYFDELWHNRKAVSLVMEGGCIDATVLTRLKHMLNWPTE